MDRVQAQVQEVAGSSLSGFHDCFINLDENELQRCSDHLSIKEVFLGNKATLPNCNKGKLMQCFPGCLRHLIASKLANPYQLI